MSVPTVAPAPVPAVAATPGGSPTSTDGTAPADAFAVLLAALVPAAAPSGPVPSGAAGVPADPAAAGVPAMPAPAGTPAPPPVTGTPDAAPADALSAGPAPAAVPAAAPAPAGDVRGAAAPVPTAPALDAPAAEGSAFPAAVEPAAASTANASAGSSDSGDGDRSRLAPPLPASNADAATALPVVEEPTAGADAEPAAVALPATADEPAPAPALSVPDLRPLALRGADQPGTPAAAPAAAPAPAPATQVVNVLAPVLEGPDGSYSLSLQLMPEELGEVQVDVQLVNGSVHVSLHSSDAEAQEVLRAALPDLRSSLEEEGLQAGSLSVGDGRAQQEREQREPRRAHPVYPTSSDRDPVAAPSSALSAPSAGTTGLDLRL